MVLRLVLIALVALPLGIGALLIAARAWRERAQARQARLWPHTMGQVVASTVRETTVRVRVGTSTGRYRMAPRYAPQVLYAYEVHARPYQNDRLRIGAVLLSSSMQDAERGAARYPVGAPVRVYYNPSNPSESTLDWRSSWGTQILWLVALGLVIMLVIIVVILMPIPPSAR
jgi:hypothetical protein